MTTPPPEEQGFTLVEMLVALAIFGMIAAGGVALLGFSVRAEGVAGDRLEVLGSLRRVGSLVGTDVRQAVGRAWRDDAGTARPAMSGGGADAARPLTLVRAGWDNPDAAPRSSLQRVEYRLEGGRLIRIGYAHVDGGAPATITTLMEEVRSLRVRFRDRDGQWLEQWPAADPTALPLAVELLSDTPRFGSVRQVFLVGAGS